jgi:citrate lyase beta subunit
VAAFPQSWLFTPGTRPDRFAGGAASGAQALLLDLEDAVAPERKDEARANVVAYLTQSRPAGVAVAVRINPLDGPFGPDDLAALAKAAPEFVLLPKAERAEDLNMVARLLEGAPRPIALLALIESARGVGHVEALVDNADRLDGLMFGAADYAADLGQSVGAFRPDHARARIVNAAAMRGLLAIDSPFFSIGEAEALAADCAAARALGFFGKAAIHPSQIGPINAAFGPTSEELDLARRILGHHLDGVAKLDGRMIDVAMIRWARRISPTPSPT